MRKAKKSLNETASKEDSGKVADNSKFIEVIIRVNKKYIVKKVLPDLLQKAVDKLKSQRSDLIFQIEKAHMKFNHERKKIYKSLDSNSYDVDEKNMSLDIEAIKNANSQVDLLRMERMSEIDASNRLYCFHYSEFLGLYTRHIEEILPQAEAENDMKLVESLLKSLSDFINDYRRIENASDFKYFIRSINPDLLKKLPNKPMG